jgi:hypothetical protein
MLPVPQVHVRSLDANLGWRMVGAAVADVWARFENER